MAERFQIEYAMATGKSVTPPLPAADELGGGTAGWNYFLRRGALMLPCSIS